MQQSYSQMKVSNQQETTNKVEKAEAATICQARWLYKYITYSKVIILQDS